MLNNLDNKLKNVKAAYNSGHLKIMILGLGSVGNYLLDYLISMKDPNIEIIVVGRTLSKLIENVNIIKVAAAIRRQNVTSITIESDCDFNKAEDVERIITKHEPNFIVNSSRVYSGLKYGSISWQNFRAYGIWTPLSMKYVKNIMGAVDTSGVMPIVINTSYSDAVIPWLKSAGKAYPDFGSGNLNHLIPRIKFAVAELYNIADYYNIDVTLAVSHFHDVVISKEGHTEGLDVLLEVKYNSQVLKIDKSKVFAMCNISMPTDARRNMMNASSNFDIINSILTAINTKATVKIHSPGVMGEIGGYPFVIDGNNLTGSFDESAFTLQDMRQANRESIAFDGVENIENGCLTYTDKLLEKIFSTFGVRVPKTIHFDEIDDTADFLIKNIIERSVKA